MTLYFLAYAILIVLAGEALFSAYLEQPFWSPEETGILVAQIFIAFIPFGLWQALWIFQSRNSKPLASPRVYQRGTILGLIVSLIIWGYYIADSLIQAPTGANIGLGILLLWSPFCIFLVMMAVWVFSK